MMDRSVLSAGIAVFALCGLAPAAASATVKCQCNDGTITQDVGADYDDDDLASACNDACSELGGGQVWTPADAAADDDENVDDVRIREERRPAAVAPRRR